jgi:hypothetical protein
MTRAAEGGLRLKRKRRRSPLLARCFGLLVVVAPDHAVDRRMLGTAADTNSGPALRGLDVDAMVVDSGARSNLLELNGARSNPRLGVELSRLGALHDELLHRASVDPREPRPAPAKARPSVLETVTLALERAGKPMGAHEIHAAACGLAGEPLLWKSVKAALAADVAGEHPRFRRVRRGVYQLARDVRHRTS